MKYLKLFETDSERVGYEGSENYLEPYVSYVEGDNTVHYNKVETKLVVYYDIQDISAPTTIFTNYDNSVKSIEVDGTLLDNVVTTYQFNSVGEHVIKFEFNDPTTVGKNAPLFLNLGTIKRVVIPNTFTAIGNSAFFNCSGLTSVTIPDSVTSIGVSAFQGCSNLTSITIPNSVTNIGNNAFNYCSSLTSITIPSGVTSIGQYAFNNTEALKILNYNAQCELNSSFRGGWSNLETVIIGDSTPSIGINAFGGCSGLTSVTIGNGVTSIGQKAFSSCSSLTSINIPSGVTSISDETFYKCSKLTNITIPSGVTSIGKSAFQYCDALTSITIPSGITSISNAAFADCVGLTSIISLATTAPTIDFNTFLRIKTEGTLYIPQNSTGYDVWMGTGDYYLGKYGWTKVEQ